MRNQIVTLRLIHHDGVLAETGLFYNKAREFFTVIDNSSDGGLSSHDWQTVVPNIVADDGNIIAGSNQFTFPQLYAISNGKLKDGDKLILKTTGKGKISIVPLYANTQDSKVEMLWQFAEYMNDEVGRELVNKPAVVKWFNDYKTKTKSNQ